ncbi:MAG: purine-nucleoside phosphorylase [Acidimicrobiales bacterium]|nr:purine-nucleoside phosphorylase [Acidimicrobiales bacterium]
MATPHIRAEAGDYAEVVLMPGDPLRAKFIAHTYLDDVRQVNDVRNMLGFTGTYEGKPVSVQGSGMGVPSLSIYATELIREFGVKKIVRVGSCGAIVDGLDLGDVVFGMAAGTDSIVNRARVQGRDFAAAADWNLLRSCVESAEARGISAKVGRLFTSDFFYDPAGDSTFDMLARWGFMAVEMEAAGLYGVAIENGAAALAVCTVSDHIMRGEHMSIDDRERSFDDMIRAVLSGALD